MNERGLRGKCFCHGEHGRKRRDLDVDRRERGLGLDQRVGGDRRQRLAVVADQVAGEERVVGDADPDLAGGIHSRHNRADARHASGLGDVETDDASRRQGRTEWCSNIPRRRRRNRGRGDPPAPAVRL
jgi:hypothetical protein